MIVFVISLILSMEMAAKLRESKRVAEHAVFLTFLLD